jgi:tRNA(Ile)-lysidine synthase
MKQSGAPSIPAYRLEALFEQVHQAGSQHNVCIRWSGWSLRLYQQQLWLHTDKEIPPCPGINWPADCDQVDLGPDVGLLLFRQTGPGDTITPEGTFSVGGRNSMNETVIGQGTLHKSLKNLFQSAGIPPWLRDSVPLCKLDDELVAMGDWCNSESFASWMSKHKLNLSWRPRHPLLQFIHSRQHAGKP